MHGLRKFLAKTGKCVFFVWFQSLMLGAPSDRSLHFLACFIYGICAADFSLLNLPKGKSLGRSKPATNSYAQALQHTVRDDFYYIQALLNCLL